MAKYIDIPVIAKVNNVTNMYKKFFIHIYHFFLAPQLGQLSADLLSCDPHSLHVINDIISSSFIKPVLFIIVKTFNKYNWQNHKTL